MTSDKTQAAPVRTAKAWAVVNRRGWVFRDTVRMTPQKAIEAYLECDHIEPLWQEHQELYGVRCEKITITGGWDE